LLTSIPNYTWGRELTDVYQNNPLREEETEKQLTLVILGLCDPRPNREISLLLESVPSSRDDISKSSFCLGSLYHLVDEELPQFCYD
jgi:hypothetical protein